MSSGATDGDNGKHDCAQAESNLKEVNDLGAVSREKRRNDKGGDENNDGAEPADASDAWLITLVKR